LKKKGLGEERRNEDSRMANAVGRMNLAKGRAGASISIASNQPAPESVWQGKGMNIRIQI